MNRALAFPLFVIPLVFAVASTIVRAESRQSEHWVGTWAAAPQDFTSVKPLIYRNQTLRLIVHTSAGGKRVRIRLSNAYGVDQPLVIGGLHIARRTVGADIDPTSDRALTFAGKHAVTIAARSSATSDPVNLDVPPLADLAISFFLPKSTTVSTAHILAQQTNYVSAEADATATASFPVAKKIDFWPFLTGVDVISAPRATAIVAFGSSLTDGDGSTPDANRRWPDVLAERLQKNGNPEIGVMNEGVIGNRLLRDTASPHQTGGPLAAAYVKLGRHLGDSGVKRFDRDVLAQPGVKYVILALGINDILFPGSFIDSTNSVTSNEIIAGNRDLIARAHKHGVLAIGTTLPPFEHALFRQPAFEEFYTPEKEKIREEVNEWVRHGGAFDGVIDFDAAVRDPNHPTQILPAFDSGDHLHVNDAGNVAQGNAIPLQLFSHRP